MGAQGQGPQQVPMQVPQGGKQGGPTGTNMAAMGSGSKSDPSFGMKPPTSTNMSGFGQQLQNQQNQMQMGMQGAQKQGKGGQQPRQMPGGMAGQLSYKQQTGI